MSRYILSRSLSVPFLAAVIQAALKRNEAQTRLKLLKLYKTQAKSRPNPIILKLLKVPANSGIQVLYHSRPQDDKKIMACINSTQTHVLLASPTLALVSTSYQAVSYWYRAGDLGRIRIDGEGHTRPWKELPAALSSTSSGSSMQWGSASIGGGANVAGSS
ncbi:hypothetical protein B0H13DRAFT_2288632 [Mycena leptocephala]|nr:hypothetical protein B0H13DRAFT_2288632 [Mycena leptocephala]